MNSRALQQGAAQVPTEDRISSAQLRKWAPLLRLDKIQAGDVLLTRGRGIESLIIAVASGGRWSHAAVWIPTPDSENRYFLNTQWPSLSLIESDDLGTGPTELRMIHLFLEANRSLAVARLQGDPEDAVLLRHPDLITADETAFDAAVSALSLTDLYRSYPSLDRLAGAAAFPPAVKSVIQRGLAFAYRAAPDSPRPGPFCSQLVANLFTNLDLSLFKLGVVPPHNVSPNHLDPSVSQLVEVPGAILSAADIGQAAFGQYSTVQVWAREVVLPAIVGGKQNSEKLSATVQRIESQIKLVSAETRRKGRQQASRLHAEILDHLIRPLGLTNADSRSVAHSLYTMSAVAVELDATLDSIESDPTLRDNPTRFQARSMMRELHSSMTDEIGHNFLRTKALTALILLRANPTRAGRRGRRRVARLWLSHKRIDAASRATVPRWFDHSLEVRRLRESAACLAEVEAITIAASEAAARKIKDELATFAVF